MLIGEYRHNVDDKSRLIIPSKFREEIGESFVLTRGLDGCLFIYSDTEWEKIVEKLKNLSFTKKDARTFMRFFLSGATQSTFDKQGRISIPSSLLEYAKISKECSIIGVDDRLEIWDLETLKKQTNDNIDYLSDIAENLFETRID